jgi:hypothetical protein
VLKRYIDLRDGRELRFGQAKDTAYVFQHTSVGSLALRERAGVRVALPTIPVGGSVDNVFAPL